MEAMERQNRVNIQIWRAFACGCVFMVHYGQRIGLEGIARQITDFGAYGVQMFFIISGFLIANSFMAYSEKNLVLFIKKKIIKLLPLYYIVVLYYFTIHTFFLRDIPIDPTGFGWIRYIIPLNGFLPRTNLYFWDNLGMTWTIPYFVFAYFVLPFLMKPIKTYKGATVLLGIAFVLNRAVPIFKGWMIVLDGFFYFCEGAFLYFVCKDRKEYPISILLGLVILLHLATGRINSLLYSLIFMYMILSTNHMEIHSEIIKKLLEISDKYSYTMYLAHGIIFIHILDRYWLRARIETIIAVFGTAIVTYVLHNYLEIPLQKWLSKLMKNQ